jgi:hypothetical protein
MSQNHGANGPLAKLATPDKVQDLRFPAEIGMIPHTITFRAFKTTQLDRSSSANKVPLTNIHLPVPANLSTAYNLDYSTDSLGAVWQTLADFAADNKYGRDARGTFNFDLSDTGKLTKTLEAMIGTSVGAAVASKIGVTRTTIMAALLSPETPVKAVLSNFGLGINPHKVVLFNSPQFRRHEFSYQFTPMSYAEAKTLKDIIRAFKYHSAPGYPTKLPPGASDGKSLFVKTQNAVHDAASAFDTSTGKHFYEYPEYFDIEFAADDQDHLFKIGNSFLEAFSVDYHPGNTPSYAKGSDDKFAPTQINIKMSFLETDIVTKENIKEHNR